MKIIYRKIAAVAEVFLVTFILVPYVVVGIYRLFPGFETWQTETLGFPVPPFIYVVEMGVPLIVILLHKGKLADYGIHCHQLRYQLDIALSCFFPVALAWIPIAMGVDYTTWGGAILLAITQVGLLLALGLILRKKAPASATVMSTALLLLVPSMSSGDTAVAGKAIVTFLFYGVFVAFGEEILFRGYMQTRLNDVFGKPYRFFEIPFGWGAIIASMLFGLMHIGIFRWILGMSTEMTLAWGFWTIFGGLVFSLVREKSGGILAPALLHGLPQAIAFTMMIFFPLSTLG
jgi:CAAX protease family protein